MNRPSQIGFAIAFVLVLVVGTAGHFLGFW